MGFALMVPDPIMLKKGEPHPRGVRDRQAAPLSFTGIVVEKYRRENAMNLKKSRLFLFVLLAGVILAGSASANEAPEYADARLWLSLPVYTETDVDVFYLYPTAWKKADNDETNICAIDNPSMLKGAKAAFDRQATAFEGVGDIYAPYYRQVDAAYSLSLSLAEQEKLVGGIPKEDAFAAFDYYIKNYNLDRPFILAGHSQGSNILLYLLSEYMKEHSAVYERMVAAYVIGYSVTDEYLDQNPHLRFAEGPDDTGVIISYNTEAPEFKGNNPVVLPGANVINPISWTREETPATREESFGSTLPNEKLEFVPVGQYADARVDKTRGVLICSTADVDKLAPGNPVFGRGVYHSFDYPFYYFDIRENAANRTKAFLEKN
jgi:hypothetical protein